MSTLSPAVSANIPYWSEVLCVYMPSMIEAEIKELLRPLSKKVQTCEDMEDDEWQDIILALLDHLGSLPYSGTYLGWVDQATERERAAVGCQLRKALKAVKYASHLADEQSTATGLLLPASYRTRVEWIVGKGILPAAWVRICDVLKFQSDIET